MGVVGASFSQLQAAILSACDFSAADAAHRQFVDGLVSQVCCRQHSFSAGQRRRELFVGVRAAVPGCR